MISIIPLTPIPNQKFRVKIPMTGRNVPLNIELRYNELSQYWTMNVSDIDGKYLIKQLPLIPVGVEQNINILEQYEYLDIGNAYILPAQIVTKQWPDSATLGVQWYLYWGDD